MKTYRVVSALDVAGLELLLNNLADSGYEFQGAFALPSTALVAIVRKASAVPVTIKETTTPVKTTTKGKI